MKRNENSTNPRQYNFFVRRCAPVRERVCTCEMNVVETADEICLVVVRDGRTLPRLELYLGERVSTQSFDHRQSERVCRELGCCKLSHIFEQLDALQTRIRSTARASNHATRNGPRDTADGGREHCVRLHTALMMTGYRRANALETNRSIIEP